MKENKSKGAMYCIDSFNLSYYSSITSGLVICMGIRLKENKSKGAMYCIDLSTCFILAVSQAGL